MTSWGGPRLFGGGFGSGGGGGGGKGGNAMFYGGDGDGDGGGDRGTLARNLPVRFTQAVAEECFGLGGMRRLMSTQDFERPCLARRTCAQRGDLDNTKSLLPTVSLSIYSE